MVEVFLRLCHPKVSRIFPFNFINNICHIIQYRILEELVLFLFFGFSFTFDIYLGIRLSLDSLIEVLLVVDESGEGLGSEVNSTKGQVYSCFVFGSRFNLHLFWMNKESERDEISATGTEVQEIVFVWSWEERIKTTTNQDKFQPKFE